jgi:hypothetical protein
MVKSLLEIIEDQLVANRLPLVGVTLAATPHTNTPVVLNLHWHGFVELKLAADGETVAWQPVPTSALQVNRRWDGLLDLEMDALETAWELGAWDLRRIEARPCGRPGAPTQEWLDCMTAFGTAPYAIDGESPVVAEVPDAEDLIEAASRAGYFRWQFRPVWNGLWKDVAEDATLEKGGYRNPSCPVMARPFDGRGARTVVYQLGRKETLDS